MLNNFDAPLNASLCDCLTGDATCRLITYYSPRAHAFRKNSRCISKKFEMRIARAVNGLSDSDRTRSDRTRSARGKTPRGPRCARQAGQATSGNSVMRQGARSASECSLAGLTSQRERATHVHDSLLDEH